jgi:hypothetical protein
VYFAVRPFVRFSARGFGVTECLPMAEGTASAEAKQIGRMADQSGFKP